MRKFSHSEYLKLCFHCLTKHRKCFKIPYTKQSIIKDLQFKKIKQLIEVAYNYTPFYNEKYRIHKITPEDIRCLEDLSYLPTITKDELAERPTDFVDRRCKRSKLIISRSSGTNGKFVTLYITPEAFIEQHIQVLRMLKEMDPFYNFLSKELLLYTSEYPFSNILGAYRVFYINNLAPIDKITSTITKVRPSVLAAYPSILHDIIANAPYDMSKSGIRTIITNSEQSTQLERNKFARTFNSHVYDEFSSEELSAIAYQCKNHKYHLVQDSSYIEILNINSDTPTPIEETGEIVGTNLLNFAMPLIRYRQGDLGALSTTKCSCGKTSPVLNKICGRINDSFVRKDGTIIPSGRLLDWIYRLVITYDLPINNIRLIQKSFTKIQLAINVNDSDFSQKTQNKIAKSFKDHFGHFFEIEYLNYDSDYSSREGKVKPIQSLLDKHTIHKCYL
ncbi:phenylacetate--CoA ligase family protein [Maridesulfovibrio sp. FT414]|uniref:phenylacetate--CoA ligase family protein n=1 Tax=Maridesulfovibrio sp. FT414 TaxID=2979469 RepID=UPI003D800C48